LSQKNKVPSVTPKGKSSSKEKKEGITQTLVSTTEVHNTITAQMEERHLFTKHLSVTKLFDLTFFTKASHCLLSFTEMD
jgi:hypothetical protein